MLAQFPPGVSSRTLRAAAERVRFQRGPGGQVPRRAAAHGPLGVAHPPRAARARRARGPEGAPPRRVFLQPGRQLPRRRRGPLAVHAADGTPLHARRLHRRRAARSLRRLRGAPRASCAATTSGSAPGPSRSPPTTTDRAAWPRPCAPSAPATSASSWRATGARPSASRRATSTPSSSPRGASTRDPERYFGPIRKDAPCRPRVGGAARSPTASVAGEGAAHPGGGAPRLEPGAALAGLDGLAERAGLLRAARAAARRSAAREPARGGHPGPGLRRGAARRSRRRAKSGEAGPRPRADVHRVQRGETPRRDRAALRRRPPRSSPS